MEMFLNLFYSAKKCFKYFKNPFHHTLSAFATSQWEFKSHTFTLCNTMKNLLHCFLLCDFCVVLSMLCTKALGNKPKYRLCRLTH